MKRFFIASGIAFVAAVIAVLAVWLYLQGFFIAPVIEQAEPLATTTLELSTTTTKEILDDSETVVAPVSIAETETETPITPVADGAAGASTAEPMGVAVASLSLSDEQKETIASLGFDPDTLVISEAMITCAREKLGESRYQALLAGAEPNIIELLKIAPCVTQ